MRCFDDLLKEAQVELKAGEQLVPLGQGAMIANRKGFSPCPWAFDLARFCPARPGDRVLDLGTGNGVLLLALKAIYPELGPCIGLELQAESASQAQRNFKMAALKDVQTVCADVRQMPVAPRAFDLVISNPPFYEPGWGRQSRMPEKAAATHALHGTLRDFAAAAARALNPRGRTIFLFDSNRLAAVCTAFAEQNLQIKTLRFLTDDRGLDSRCLILAGRDLGGLIVERMAYGGVP